jgi:predicted Zn-dependent protease
VKGVWSAGRQKLEVHRALAAMTAAGESGDQDSILQEGRAGDMIWLRMLLQKYGDHGQAGALLDDFLRQQPHSVAAWMMRLEDDVEAHDMAQARQTLARIQTLDLQPAALKPFVLGQAFHLLGLGKEAQQAYRKVDRQSRFRLRAEIYLTEVSRQRKWDGIAPAQAQDDFPQEHASHLVPDSP